MGGGFLRNESNSTTNIIDGGGQVVWLGNKVNSLGQAFLFGMSFEMDRISDPGLWTLGARVAATHNLNSGGGSFVSTALNQTDEKHHRAFLDHSFELALRVGRLLADGDHLFVKAGGVLSQWVFKSYYMDRFVAQKKYLAGIMAGAGLDMQISPKIAAGLSLQYEWYPRQKGDYHGNDPAPATRFVWWEAKPSVFSANAHLKYRFGHKEPSSQPQRSPMPQPRPSQDTMVLATGQNMTIHTIVFKKKPQTYVIG